MSSKTRTAKQAAKDRAALKRLKKSGTYRGKIDLRKAPTPYQLKKIKALAKSKAKTQSKEKRAMPPAAPSRGGAKVKRDVLTEKQVRGLKPSEGKYELTTYALPFHRKGRDEPEWRRFTRNQLIKFLEEYKGDNPDEMNEWKSYAVRETWTFPSRSEQTEMRRDVNLFFSGARIDEPNGEIVKKLQRKRRN